MEYATILNRDDDGDGNTHNHNHNHNHNNHNLSPKPEHNHHHAPFATSATTPSSSSASSYPNLYPPPAAASTTASTLPMPQHHQSPEYPPHPSPRDKHTTATTTTTSYYDPTTDSSERRPSQSDNNPPAWHEAQQSVTTPQPREPYAYPSAASTEQAPPQQQQQPPAPYYNGTYTSPGAANSFPPRSPVSHAHPPPPRRPSISQSPRVATMPSPALHNGAAMPAPIIKQEQPGAVPAPAPAPVATPNRPADPMSFSSILSNADPSPKASPTPSAKLRKASAKSLPPPPVADPLSRDSSRQPSPVPVAPVAASRVPTKRKSNGEAKAKASPKPKVISKEQETEVQALLATLEAEADEIDMADYENDKQVYEAAKLKRKLDMEMGEVVRNKRRRTRYAEIQARKLGHHAGLGMQRYRYIHADEAITAVQQREIEAEKIRKKDMQRKRRREKTIQQHKEHADAALLKAQESTDIVERERLFKEANKAQKKIQQTKMIIAEGDKGPSMRAMSPLEHNFSGGMISTFNVVDPEPKVKGKRGGPGSRPRKSKEQKQAEKDSAEAAQAAIDAGEEIPQFTLTPIIKEEPRLRIKLNNREPRDSRDSSPAFVPPANFEPYVSKGYNQIYDQIWRDLARKDVSKVYKLAVDMREVRGTNLKKTAVLASKEAKRWQLRTNKGTKDLQARAKRVMREMMSYWKHNERVDRDTRRAAEKQEIENMKRAEADREANRQKRKLDFLISQTELYSHFIGDKIKTSEVERSTDNPDVASADAGADGTSNVKTLGAIAPGKVTDLKDIDFDAEDDSTLQAAAAANAQAAIAEAQAKARAFNGPSGGPDMDEEGEMNFQNPSGMGSVEIEQPTMLQAQLKEYQLKGLNWLVNLYDNGINGILADEMGLGKTIQSISVMAYLAEKFGIWGPFLVVAPASTLHNWQQEITKFVPRLKVLPYWGTAADRKVLRKFWDRRHVTYTEDADFHVLVTSYQLVVSDVAYFQKMTWQYMILDEAQAIKSSQSSRWKSLLGFHCRNRLLLTGTPIQNNMQELWALLHFIMPSLFDSHDEFSEWFSKDIESHAQSNTKLNQEQLTRLHLILKPFMLRRVKKHVQKELGDKIEIDLFCDLTYRQRAYYANLRNQISIIDLIEKATLGDDNDTGTLMNLVMQFRKVCNHPDLFERAETSSPFSFGSFAQTGSFMREGNQVNVKYSTKNMIEYPLPKLVWQEGGRLDVPGQDNQKAGFKGKYLDNLLNIWRPENIHEHVKDNESFSFLRFSDTSIGELSAASHKDVFGRAVDLSQRKQRRLGELNIVYDEEDDKNYTPAQAMFRIVDRQDRKPLAEVTKEGHLNKLFNVAKDVWSESGIGRLEQCSRPAASAPPIEVFCHSQSSVIEKENILFNIPMRRALYGPSPVEEQAFVTSKVSPSFYPPTTLLPAPSSEKQRFTNIQVPSMRRFVTDSGKLAKLDDLLFKLKEGGHRVLLYFQMTRMIDLMEEYLTYRNYKYCRLDGSTKLEDRRDTVHDFQTRPEIFIFLLSTRAGGLGINLTSADTVIFYDSDWNPTIDSQAMDRSHRLGQTRQVTVYRMITRGTIEERIRKRALQKEEVQKVVMTGQGGAGVDFNTRSKENRTKDIAMWLVDDDEAALIERKEQEMAAMEATQPERVKKKPGRKKKVEASGSLEDLYHEGEGHFDDGSNKPSGTATPTTDPGAKPKRGRKPGSGKKAKTAKQRFAMADGDVDMHG